MSDTRTAASKRKKVVRDAQGFPQLCAFSCTRCLPFLSVPKRVPCPLLPSRMPWGAARGSPLYKREGKFLRSPSARGRPGRGGQPVQAPGTLGRALLAVGHTRHGEQPAVR